jgi:GAF domain-containing protein
MMDQPELEAALAQANHVIAEQTETIDQLRRRLADDRFAQDLREALSLAAAAGVLAAPLSHSQLLEMVVETAAQVINSQAAALFLIDDESQELVFEVALGQKATEVKKFRLPLGHGIAGLVAVSGQPMAVADADRDPRQASDIARSVGYVPRSILCVPLFYADRVIGVLELLDKVEAATFSSTDMHVLGLFANQAAVAIEHSRVQRSLTSLVQVVLQSLLSSAGASTSDLAGRTQAFVEGLEENPPHRRALDLARLVRLIADWGEPELLMCETILRGFVDYLQSRPRADDERWSPH